MSEITFLKIFVIIFAVGTNIFVGMYPGNNIDYNNTNNNSMLKSNNTSLFSLTESFHFKIMNCTNCSKENNQPNALSTLRDLPKITWDRCVHIRSYKTRNFIYPSKSIKFFVHANVFVQSLDDPSFIINNKWDIYKQSSGINTISISFSNYWLTKKDGCIKPNPNLIVFEQRPKRNNFFIDKINDLEKMSIFSLSICGQCVYVNEINTLNVKKNCSFDDDNYFFLSAPPPTEICSLLVDVFIRTVKTNLYLKANRKQEKKFVFTGDHLINEKQLVRWNVHNYIHYTLIRSEQDESFYWSVDSKECGANNLIVVKTGDNTIDVTNQIHLDFDPLRKSFKMEICEKTVMYDRKNLNLVATDEQINPYDNLFYHIHRTANQRCSKEEGVFIRVIGGLLYLGIKEVEPGVPVVGMLKQNASKWDVFFCPGYIKVRVHSSKVFNWENEFGCNSTGKIILWEGATEHKTLHRKIYEDPDEHHMFVRYEQIPLSICGKCLYLDPQRDYELRSGDDCSEQTYKYFYMSST